MLPNFMIIGAKKAGTTTLYHYLRQHPDVYMSDSKELWYFDYQYEKGLKFYENYFASHQGEKLVGEATPQLLALPFAIPRIKQDLPGVKLIAILREPVSRAYSHWWMAHAYGVDKLSFEDAVADNLARIEQGLDFAGDQGRNRWLQWVHAYRFDPSKIANRPYIDMGYYAEQLVRFQEAFGAEQVKVVLLDDIKRNHEAVIRSLWEFLGVSPDCEFTEPTSQNPALGGQTARIYAALRKFGFHRLAWHLPQWMRSLVKSKLSKIDKQPKINPQTKAMLIEHYRPHNEALAALLDRDLTNWLQT